MYGCPHVNAESHSRARGAEEKKQDQSNQAPTPNNPTHKNRLIPPLAVYICDFTRGSHHKHLSSEKSEPNREMEEK